MAPVKTLQGGFLLIKIGDGATPTEVFAHDCWINTERGIEFTSDVNEILVPDCDDPMTTGWKEIFKDGLSATITGAGVMHTPSTEDWYDWFEADVAKNVQILLSGVTLANGGGHWAGAFKLTQFSVTGPVKNNSTTESTLVSHGPVVWVPAT